MNNKCGECRACCTTLGVRALRKDEFVRCQHVCPAGCAIYRRRPSECRVYECLWLALGEGVLATRPDKLGCVLDIQGNDDMRALGVRELRGGAADVGAAKLSISWLAQNLRAFILLFREGKETRKIFPAHVSHLAKRADSIVVKSWRDVEVEENARV